MDDRRALGPVLQADAQHRVAVRLAVVDGLQVALANQQLGQRLLELARRHVDAGHVDGLRVPDAGEHVSNGIRLHRCWVLRGAGFSARRADLRSSSNASRLSARASPARLDDARQVALVCHLADADPAEAEITQIGAGPATTAAAVHASANELGLANGLGDLGFGSHVPSLLPERHPEELEKATRFLVVPGRRHDGDVHAAGGIDLVVVDLREHQLLLDAEAVVAAAVEAVGADPPEVPNARQGHVDQLVEERPHAHTAQRDLEPDRHAGADLEVRHRLLRLGDDRSLQRDLTELLRGTLEHLGVLTRLAESHVDDDLLHARKRHGVGVGVPLDELGLDVLVALLDG